MKNLLLILLAGFSFSVSIGSTAHAQLRVIAVSGQTAPTSDPTTVFDTVVPVAINIKGNVLIQASIVGDSIISGENSLGMWIEEQPGVISQVTQTGNQAFDMPAGVSFSALPYPSGFSDSNHVMFTGRIVGPGIEDINGNCGIGAPDNDIGVWQANVNGGNLVVQAADAAPGTPEGTVFHCVHTNVRQNELGGVAFSASVYDGTSRTKTGIWRTNGSGALEPVVLPGEQALEIPTNTSSPFTIEFAKIVGHNNLGTVAAYLWENPSGTGSPSAISLSKNGLPRTTMALLEDEILDIGPGVVIDAFGEISRDDFEVALNNHDRIAVPVTLKGPGIVPPDPVSPESLPAAQSPPGNNRAIAVLDLNQQPKVLVQSGQEVGGIGDSNLVYYSVGQFGVGSLGSRGSVLESPLGFNDEGEVLFQASINSLVPDPNLNSLNNDGLWLIDKDQNTHIVIREGDIAPGTTEPFIFRSFQFEYMLNNLGQVAVEAVVGGKKGIWATDLQGQLRLIVLEGQSIDLGNGDARLVEELFVSLNPHEEPASINANSISNFNDRGQLTFGVRFPDGSSAAFVSNLVAIPEPTTCMLMVLATLALRSSRCSVRT